METEQKPQSLRHPIIGCSTYRKKITAAKPYEYFSLMTSYAEAITAAGGIPMMIPLGLAEGALDELFGKVDGLLLPGGGDVDPGYYNGPSHETLYGVDGERDRTEMYLARLAVRERKPFLAICRGVQVLNVALGGTLWQDIASEVTGSLNHNMPESYPRDYLSHEVQITTGSCLARQMGVTEVMVNSWHHQAIRELASGMEVTAKAPDGIIEAVEMADHPYGIGVQWHPENLVAEHRSMLALFKGLVAAAAK